MSRSRPPALPPESDKPRVMVDYGGMQILDCQEHLRVKLVGDPPSGVRYLLRDAGFRPMPGDGQTFFRTANPKAIFDAQMIGATFFPITKETP